MIDVDPEIVEICKKRVIDHIKRVKFFYNKLVEAGIIPEKDIDFARIAKHDADKLEPYNLKRQACRFTKTGTVTPEQKEAANDVIREHIKNNPHHSEFWGAPSDDQFSTNVDCTKTPDTYMYELVADWMATAEERGTNCMDWYNKHVGKRWIYNEHQCDILKKCINILDKYQGPKRGYGLSYLSPGQMNKAIKEKKMEVEYAKSLLTEHGYKVVLKESASIRDAIQDAYPELDYVVDNEGESQGSARFCDDDGHYVQVDKVDDAYNVMVWQGKNVIEDDTVDSIEGVVDFIGQYFN